LSQCPELVEGTVKNQHIIEKNYRPGTKMNKILIIDDNSQIRMLLRDRLQANNYKIIEAENGKKGIELCLQKNPDLVLLDLQMPVMDGTQVLKRLNAESMDIPVVVLTAFGTIERAVEAMKLGAIDFLPKPCNPDHILLVVKKALEGKNLKEENKYLKSELGDKYHMLIGNNSQMQQVVNVAETAAKSKSTILIEGESGTGKQLLAHFIHKASDRKSKPFVQVNCATLSDQLIESDLFGHEKGAFTGAIKQKKGRFELANNGTIFLDEIGELPASLQAKLLHVLEYGEFQRVGGVETISVDVRIIAATNRELQAEIQSQNFREDLFYRLNIVNLKLPALQSHKEDIPIFGEYFLQKHSQAMGRTINGFSKDCLTALQKYHWPGNIRELENAIERAVVLARGDELTPDLLPLFTPNKLDQELEIGTSLESAILQFKKQFIEKTLQSTNNNQTKAAKLLEIQRTYLNKLIKDLEIDSA
jgi:two-component system, NtrC family, response regulator AtoC